MMIIHKDLIQGTDEWLNVRKGKITASVVKQCLTSTFKVSKDKKITLLAYDLAAERLTGRLTPSYESFDMARGKAEEMIARDLYSKHYAPVEEVGFIENGILGFSPDGLVGDDGIIEIKSRLQKYQVKTVHENAIPLEYICQCQTGLLVSKREWCDFIQYSNGMPLFVKRAYRDDEIISAIHEAAWRFEDMILEIMDEYRRNADGLYVADYVEMAPVDMPDMDFE